MTMLLCAELWPTHSMRMHPLPVSWSDEGKDPRRSHTSSYSGFISVPSKDLKINNDAGMPCFTVKSFRSLVAKIFILKGWIKFFKKDTRNVLYEEISLHLLDNPNIGKLTQCKDGTRHGVKNKWRVSFQNVIHPFGKKDLKDSITKVHIHSQNYFRQQNCTINSCQHNCIGFQWHCFHMAYI